MNPYQKWLGISNGSKKPDYFMLLGVSRSEEDPVRFKSAARTQLKKLEPHRQGKHSQACEEIRARVKKAYRILKDPKSRTQYINALAQKENASANSAVIVAEVAEDSFVPSSDLMDEKPGVPISVSLDKPQTRRLLLPIVATICGLVCIVAVAGGLWMFLSQQSDVAQREPLPVAIEEIHDNDAASPNDQSIESVTKQFFPEPLQSSTTRSKTNEPEIAEPETADSEINRTVVDDIETMDSAVSSDDTSAQDENTEETEVAEATTDAAEDEQPANEQGADIQVTATVKARSQVSVVDTSEPLRILNKYCADCHGGNGAEEGGFDFVSNLEQLKAHSYVLPFKPQDSPLLQRIKSTDSPMPPAGEARPTDEEVAMLEAWIESGAASAETEKQDFVSNIQHYQILLEDIKKVPSRDRQYMRYFTANHLVNAGVLPNDLEKLRLGLTKLLNSLSWHRRLAVPVLIDERGATVRIDLRDFKWNAETWKKILDDYEYLQVYNTDAAKKVSELTACLVPVVRSDWFVANASRPPLYHQLLELPQTEDQLEDLLQVDVQTNIAEGTTVRAGFAQSGVSQNNRLIERHDSTYGVYWKSYDFASNVGQSNLFEYPLGPGSSFSEFEHDGSEMIFTLPNGMLGFMLVNTFGGRIDKGPIEIVSDPRQPDRAVVNGLSCMSCHYAGFIPKNDEVRKHVLANRSAFSKLDEILGLYPGSEKVRQLVSQDSKLYVQKLNELGIEQPTMSGEPIVYSANKFGGELDINLASAELDLTPDQFEREIKLIEDATLVRQIGPLRVSGGVIKRETFARIFSPMIGELFPDVRVPSVESIARFDSDKRPKVPIAESSPIFPEKSFGNRRDAERALKSGNTYWARRDLKQATTKMIEAVERAPDQEFRLMVYERAMPLFETMDTINMVVEGHAAILDKVATSGSLPVHKAHDKFMESIVRHVLIRDKEKALKRRMTFNSTVLITDINVPVLAANLIERTFQQRLKLYPQHEGALLVLQTFYDDIQKDDKKMLEMIRRREVIYANRNEKLFTSTRATLAKALLEDGEALQAAELLHDIIKELRSRNRVSSSVQRYLILEAQAWLEADKSAKAVETLDDAAEVVQESFSDGLSMSVKHRQLLQIADLYMELNNSKKAVPLYKIVLQAETTEHRVKTLQEKLKTAMNLAAGKTESSESTEDLLDPLRAFRVKAEKYEQDSTGKSPSTRYTSMSSAAKLWLQAKEKTRASEALLEAEDALQRWTKSSLRDEHTSIARLFLAVDMNQKALEHFVEALKRNKYAYNIPPLQKEMQVLLDRDDSLAVSEEVLSLVNPKYRFRFMANQKENEKPRRGYFQVRELIAAAELWRQADEMDDAKRCARKAAVAIEQTPPLAYGEARLQDRQHGHQDLAEWYQKAELYSLAVKHLVGAIDCTSQDYEARQYYDEIERLCKEHSIEMPELPQASAEKTDPLNPVRKQAVADEKMAEEVSGHMTVHFYISAIENWIKAKELKLAAKTAEKCRTYINEQEPSDDRLGISTHSCQSLAEVFVKLKMNDEAIEMYEKAIKLSKNKHGNDNIKRKIKQLRSR